MEEYRSRKEGRGSKEAEESGRKDDETRKEDSESPGWPMLMSVVRRRDRDGKVLTSLQHLNFRNCNTVQKHTF